MPPPTWRALIHRALHEGHAERAAIIEFASSRRYDAKAPVRIRETLLKEKQRAEALWLQHDDTTYSLITVGERMEAGTPGASAPRPPDPRGHSIVSPMQENGNNKCKKPMAPPAKPRSPKAPPIKPPLLPQKQPRRWAPVPAAPAAPTNASLAAQHPDGAFTTIGLIRMAAAVKGGALPATLLQPACITTRCRGPVRAQLAKDGILSCSSCGETWQCSWWYPLLRRRQLDQPAASADGSASAVASSSSCCTGSIGRRETASETDSGARISDVSNNSDVSDVSSQRRAGGMSSVTAPAAAPTGSARTDDASAPNDGSSEQDDPLVLAEEGGPSGRAPTPPPDWVWPREGDRIEVEVEAAADAETDGASKWCPAVVRSVLVDGWFCAEIRLADGSDQWEDWFTWKEENSDWRRAPKRTGGKRARSCQPTSPVGASVPRRTSTTSDGDATCTEGASGAIDAASATVEGASHRGHQTEKQRGKVRDPPGKRSQVGGKPSSDGDGRERASEGDGGERVSDVSNVSSQRRAGGMSSVTAPAAAPTGSARTDDASAPNDGSSEQDDPLVLAEEGGPSGRAPTPPPDWVWPREGDRIEVEVEAAADAETDGASKWCPAVVRSVLVDGWFCAEIRLADGSDQWEDWFTWKEENSDWRRAPKRTGGKRARSCQPTSPVGASVPRRTSTTSDGDATCTEGASGAIDAASATVEGASHRGHQTEKQRGKVRDPPGKRSQVGGTNVTVPAGQALKGNTKPQFRTKASVARAWAGWTSPSAKRSANTTKLARAGNRIERDVDKAQESPAVVPAHTAVSME